MPKDANEIAAEAARRERETRSVPPTEPRRGELSILDNKVPGGVLATHHDVVVMLIEGLVVAEQDGTKIVYNLGPGQCAYFEPHNAGE